MDPSNACSQSETRTHEALARLSTSPIAFSAAVHKFQAAVNELSLLLGFSASDKVIWKGRRAELPALADPKS